MPEADILDHPLISESYFFPRSGAIAAPYWVDVADARLACSYHEVDPAGLTVVHFHGNGEIVADYVDLLPPVLARFGCNCLLAEFRGYGLSTGRPGLGRMLDDAEAIMASLPGPVGRTVLFGRSVGSIPALHAAAAHPEVAGLIIESGIAGVLERLLLRVEPEELGVTPDRLERAVAAALDQRKKIQAFPGPLLVLHADRDTLVDVSHAERLFRWSGSRFKTLQVFPRGDHNSIMSVNAAAYFERVGNFLREVRERVTRSAE